MIDARRESSLMDTSGRPISEVLQDIVSNVQDILRSEVRLAKAEIREEAAAAKGPALMLGIGAVSAIFSALFLLLAAVYALSNVVPNWAAALIVGVVLAAVGSILVAAGAKRFEPGRRVHNVSEKLKENLEWAKPQIK
jgi:uncharacterized membrane protein YqjE